MLQIKHLTVLKKCLIFSFQDVQTCRGRRKYSAPPAQTENYCESKQTYFSYTLGKASHFPEFQAKLFSCEIEWAFFTEIAY